ncbi:E3 ISG15--protein ligase HERC5 [Bienertia sinuspersici]
MLDSDAVLRYLSKGQRFSILTLGCLQMMDQFGAGATIPLDSPQPHGDDSEGNSETQLKVSAIEAGGMMFVAIDNLGVLWMWGNIPQPSSSDGDTFTLKSFSAPIPMWEFYGHTVVKVTCGNEHVVALVSAGENHSNDDNLVCYGWGNNKHGQLGLGDTESRSRPQVVTQFSQVSVWKAYEVACGAFHTVVLTLKKRPSDTLESVCWTFGLGENGQLGHGTTQNSSLPKSVSGLPEYAYFVAVDCGLFHTSVVSTAGEVWSWGMEKGLGLCPDGRGRSGVLGDGKARDSYTPTMVLWPPLSEDFNDGLNSTDTDSKKPEKVNTERQRKNYLQKWKKLNF